MNRALGHIYAEILKIQKGSQIYKHQYTKGKKSWSIAKDLTCFSYFLPPLSGIVFPWR